MIVLVALGGSVTQRRPLLRLGSLSRVVVVMVMVVVVVCVCVCAGRDNQAGATRTE